MTDNEFRPSDRLYYAIEAIRGWDRAADRARRHRDRSWRLGRIISAILLAAGEERELIAVTGALDEQGNGNLAVIYDKFVVLVDVIELSNQNGDVAVKVHTFDEIDEITVSTTHNYFDGTEEHARHDGMELQIRLAGQRLVFPPSTFGQSPLVQNDAAREAYTAIRDQRTAQ